MTTVHSYRPPRRPSRSLQEGLEGWPQRRVLTSSRHDRCGQGVALVLPQVQGQAERHGLPVPTPTVSVVDLTFKTEKETT